MTSTELPIPFNTATLLKTGFDGCDLSPLRAQRMACFESDHTDAAALIDLCHIEQILGNPVSGLRYQNQALRLDRLYRSSWPASPNALRVLAFLAPGDISSNTPIDFLLQNSDVVLYSLYIVPGQPLPDPLPEHDVAIVIAGESDQARAVLREIERLIPVWQSPVLNRPAGVLRLSRGEMFQVLEDVPGIVMPATTRIRRSGFEKLTRDAAFPLIARPVDSHAGRALAKLDDEGAAAAYLCEHPDSAEFYVSRYVDYRSPDGLFRKYRIVWIDGRPYPCHMAIADEWKVWYLNANMDASSSKRAEEARFLCSFNENFARHHEQALAAAAERFGLEYVGIDCAETPDGKLLVFEGDIALVVHDMDPPELYPYKGPRMREVFTAFYEMLRRHARRT